MTIGQEQKAFREEGPLVQLRIEGNDGSWKSARGGGWLGHLDGNTQTVKENFLGSNDARLQGRHNIQHHHLVIISNIHPAVQGWVKMRFLDLDTFLYVIMFLLQSILLTPGHLQ